ncbi:class I SAM-dependent methyltransferase [Sphingomonas baiyangensis]|uniref:class I SAM-dependent methyltransferase n=1 Tax=Sphingomonas baiyangensis TaxID=2572576 RepID=UPI001BAF1737|nr:class I SAM-dependent methyltransferase [Sphingomonas baiyangensis]
MGSIDPQVDHHHRVYYEAPAAARVAWVKRFKQKGLLLDIGCGDGEFTRAAIGAGFEVEGIEPNPDRVATVKKRSAIPVEQGLIEESSLPAGRYDASFHVDLLSHFPDPVAALRAIAEKMRDDGVICFEVGLFSNLPLRWRRLAGRANMPTHLWFFDAPSIEHLLDAAGLKLVAMRRYKVGVSTAVSAALVAMRRERAVAATRAGLPMARGRASGVYYRFHMWLRYGLGRWLPIGGPQTAFVAAVRRLPAS